MDPGKLMPDNSQVFGALRDLYAHQTFDGLCVAHRMPECADAADSLRDVYELVVVLRLHEPLEAAVDEPDLRHGLDDHFVLDDKVEVKRLGKHRMLRTERDYRFLAHATPLPCQRRSAMPVRSARPLPFRLCRETSSKAWLQARRRLGSNDPRQAQAWPLPALHRSS